MRARERKEARARASARRHALFTRHLAYARAYLLLARSLAHTLARSASRLTIATADTRESALDARGAKAQAHVNAARARARAHI